MLKLFWDEAMRWGPQVFWTVMIVGHCAGDLYRVFRPPM